MNYRNKFITWYNNVFKADPIFQPMRETVEGSPWHRERNVEAHTDMVVAEYISWAPQKWELYDLYGAIACAFHDTGKPAARVVRYKPERGNYNSFGGHEIISTRLFEDYAIRNLGQFEDMLGVQGLDFIYPIEFIIEHHMPYDQPADKVADIARTVNVLFGGTGADAPHPVFVNHLTADVHGRIADDHAKKIAAVDQWASEFQNIGWGQRHNLDPFATNPNAPTLHLAIGPSGCGKSTLLKNLQKVNPDLVHYSWDLLRLEWYSPDYAKAYQMSVDDPHFNARYTKVFREHILSGKDIYVDNTNLSRKRRKPWVVEARKHGYNIVAYILPNSIDALLKRQKTRGDKDVPADAVRKHYMSVQVPLYGEVDRVEVINTL
jgi:predicted kinase